MRNETTLNTGSVPTTKKFSLRRLSSEDWSWIHFKFAIMAWAITLLFFTPKYVASTLGSIATIFTILTAVGVIVSVAGLVMSAQYGRIGLIGLTIEYSGIVFTAAGPFSYSITQAYLATILPNGDQRYALTILGYVVLAALFARFRTVRTKRKRAMQSYDVPR